MTLHWGIILSLDTHSLNYWNEYIRPVLNDTFSSELHLDSKQDTVYFIKRMKEYLDVYSEHTGLLMNILPPLKATRKDTALFYYNDYNHYQTKKNLFSTIKVTSEKKGEIAKQWEIPKTVDGQYQVTISQIDKPLWFIGMTEKGIVIFKKIF